MRRPLIAIGVCLILFCPVILRAQSGTAPPTFVQIQKWIQLAKGHQIGRSDGSLRTLASWSPEQIQIVNEDLELISALLDAAANGAFTGQRAGRILNLRDLAPLLDIEPDAFHEPGLALDPIEVAKPDGRARDAIAKTMMQAAMLETDLILASFDEASGIRLPRLTSTNFHINDAQLTGAGNLELFWDTARQAMDLAEPTPRYRALARQWYDVTAEYLIAHRDYAVGVPHIEHGRDVLPDDAKVAFYLGIAYENLAGPAIQAAFEGLDPAFGGSRPPALLAKAELQLRAALALDPDFADASLHLGHVLELLGRPDEALPHLQRIDDRLPRPELRYFAALFVGRAHEDTGRVDEARAAFERAIKQFPDAQSPQLALARLKMRTEGQTEALAQIRGLTGGSSAADPWWSYDISSTTGLGNHFAALRESVVKVLR